MPFTTETALSCRNRGVGRKSAAYWRELGFPNLVLARKARWKGHVRKDQGPKELRIDSPFAIEGRRPRGF